MNHILTFYIHTFTGSSLKNADSSSLAQYLYHGQRHRAASIRRKSSAGRGTSIPPTLRREPFHPDCGALPVSPCELQCGCCHLGNRERKKRRNTKEKKMEHQNKMKREHSENFIWFVHLRFLQQNLGWIQSSTAFIFYKVIEGHWEPLHHSMFFHLIGKPCGTSQIEQPAKTDLPL